MSQIMLNLELHEGNDIMSGKDHVKEYGASTATTLCLTHPYHGTGRRLIADSWFGLVKCATELMNQGLYGIMLVKTAHKNFRHQLLGNTHLQRGEWVAHTTEKDGIKL